MNLGAGGGAGGGADAGATGGGGGFNPIGVMAGLAVGGAMGGQMANMMNNVGQATQQSMSGPPPLPQVAYHVVLNGLTAGPFNLGQLQQMATTGQFGTNSHVWKAGMANWELAGSIPELAPTLGQFASPPPPPPPAPPPGN
jgi:hypothetical protein